MTSAPAPSAFALPRPRSHFPRPRSHFSRIAFRGPRRAIGILQQQLSTMGYPRKSYPHRCPPPCAKRSRPRACARVYIIYRSPVGCSRGVSALLPKRVRAAVRRVGEGEGKGGRPLAQCRTMPLVCRITVRKGGSAPGQPRPCRAFSPRQLVYARAPARLCAESLCAKAEAHRANPAPARALSPRQPVYGRAPAR